MEVEGIDKRSRTTDVVHSFVVLTVAIVATVVMIKEKEFAQRSDVHDRESSRDASVLFHLKDKRLMIYSSPVISTVLRTNPGLTLSFTAVSRIRSHERMRMSAREPINQPFPERASFFFEEILPFQSGCPRLAIRSIINSSLFRLSAIHLSLAVDTEPCFPEAAVGVLMER